MEIRLEGQNLIIPLDEFEAKVAKKAMPLISAYFGFLTKLMIRLIFHILQTDRKAMREAFERISAGEDPQQVIEPLLAGFQDMIRTNPKLMETLDKLSIEDIEQLLPESNEEDK